MRSVSPIQRMAAVLLMIVIVIWFFRTQSRHFTPEIPLIKSVEIQGQSLSLDYDKLYCEKILQMKTRQKTDVVLYFENGLTLNRVKEITEQDTIVLQTGRILDVWKEVLASPATVIRAPFSQKGRICASFKLPGGQIIMLAEIE